MCFFTQTKTCKFDELETLTHFLSNACWEKLYSIPQFRTWGNRGNKTNSLQLCGAFLRAFSKAQRVKLIIWICALNFMIIHPSLAETFTSEPQISASCWCKMKSEGITGGKDSSSTMLSLEEIQHLKLMFFSSLFVVFFFIKYLLSIRVSRS